MLLIGLLAVAVLGGFGGMFYLKSTAAKAVPRAETTLCPVSGPEAISIVLLDATDDLPSVAKHEITTILTDAVNRAGVDELVEIRLLDPQQRGGRTIFSRCNPGDGSGLSEWTANPVLARKRWIESFQKPLQAALQDGLRPSQALISPIMSTVQMIAVERFTGRPAENARKRLILLSDLIEHNSKYSQYTGSLSYDSFKRSDFYRDIRTNLNGAEVFFYQIQRRTRKPIPSNDLIKFWIEWASDNNGRFQEALKLQGLS